MLYHVLPSQSILEQLRMQLNKLNGFVNVFGPDERRSQIDISCPASYQKDWCVDHNKEHWLYCLICSPVKHNWSQLKNLFGNTIFFEACFQLIFMLLVYFIYFLQIEKYQEGVCGVFLGKKIKSKNESNRFWTNRIQLYVIGKLHSKWRVPNSKSIDNDIWNKLD